MNDVQPRHETPIPRWLHRWAVLTVCAALPLVLLGAEVTTRQVGMADPQSIRTPWYLLTIPMPALLERGLGYLIEHSHRLAGWLVGGCAIVLAVGMGLGIRQNPVRWLGLLALVMVSAQGILGIFRVKLHALAGPDLALVHGLFAQLVVATLVGVAVMTSRAWWQGTGWQATTPRPRGLALLLAGLIFLQISFGAIVRHFHYGFAQRLHVLVAFAVVGVAIWLVRTLWERGAADAALRRASLFLIGLLCLQVALGVEAWMGRFGSGVPVELLQSRPGLDFVRSAHFVVGTLLFATSVMVNLLLVRPAAFVRATAPRVEVRKSMPLQTASAGGMP